MVSCSVVSDSLWPHGLEPTRLLCPWNFPGKNTGVGCRFLLQRIFPSQRLNLGLLHCRQTLYCLSHQGSPLTRKHVCKIHIKFISRPILSIFISIYTFMTSQKSSKKETTEYSYRRSTYSFYIHLMMWPSLPWSSPHWRLILTGRSFSLMELRLELFSPTSSSLPAS